MKKVLAVFGVAAACAACCAIPVALPLVAGLAASGLGLAISGWQFAAALLLATGLLGVWIVMRNRQRGQVSLVASQNRCACPAQPANAEVKGDGQ